MRYGNDGYCTDFICFCVVSASEHPYKGIFTALPKPGGGEFGKFYSLPALNDPRIGMILYISIEQFDGAYKGLKSKRSAIFHFVMLQINCLTQLGFFLNLRFVTVITSK